jgi:hypothetical protein
MSFVFGGSAAKLGDRYEGRWIVKQLLRLLSEQVQSVQIEAMGDDEAGVDLWVLCRDGTREAQQCKAHNRSRPSWTVKSLAQRGVLEYSKTQLDRSESHTFAFISSVPSVELSELSDRARSSPDDPEEFYTRISQMNPAGLACDLRQNPEKQASFADSCHADGKTQWVTAKTVSCGSISMAI